LNLVFTNHDDETKDDFSFDITNNCCSFL